MDWGGLPLTLIARFPCGCWQRPPKYKRERSRTFFCAVMSDTDDKWSVEAEWPDGLNGLTVRLSGSARSKLALTP